MEVWRGRIRSTVAERWKSDAKKETASTVLEFRTIWTTWYLRYFAVKK